ncbi:MAG: Ig-like domain-containing protein [Spirochaetaceae bacterium]|nr:Ig-like domain-containing protein [Spirochaetaceae bacterium]
MYHFQSNIAKITAINLVCLLVFGCTDFLLPPLEVVSCSFETSCVEINFCRPPTSESIRNGFSLTEDGTILDGDFTFQDSRIFFYPKQGIQPHRNYLLELTEAVEDEKGYSLLQPYVLRYSTRQETLPPFVKAILPKDDFIYKLNSPHLPEIEVFFSEPIDQFSFDKAFSLSPAVEYITEFSKDSDSVKLILCEPLELGTLYQIKISTELEDLQCNKMRQNFDWVFRYGIDTEAPVQRIYHLSPYNNSLQQVFPKERINVATDSVIRIEWNEPVDLDAFSNYICLEPDLPVELSFDKKRGLWAEIAFADGAEWGKTYYLRIKKGLSDFFGNQIKDDFELDISFSLEEDRPVKFIKGFIKNGLDFFNLSPQKPYDSISFDPILFPVVENSKAVATDLYLFFTTSSKATSLDRFSVMENLTISATNSCLELIIKNLNIIQPTEMPIEAYEQFAKDNVLLDLSNTDSAKLWVIKCSVEVINSEAAGLLTLTVGSGVCDNLGNTMVSDSVCVVNKS